MPKENPYLAKENYKKVEEVREIENKELITPKEQARLKKNEYPSYEELRYVNIINIEKEEYLMTVTASYVIFNF